MTLRQLATFLELSRSGSVKVAAERLYVTQPAVSAVIASLQRELGVGLVAREGRGLRLTPSGMVLAEYARRIQGTLDEAAVATVGAGPGARLRLAAVTTAGEHILPAAIASFRSSHPGTEVSVEVANREHVWERLEAHEVDLVVGGGPAPPPTSVVCRPARCDRTSWSSSRPPTQHPRPGCAPWPAPRGCSARTGRARGPQSSNTWRSRASRQAR
jgi:DNA-binding transcriptional LysR family regulator